MSAELTPEAQAVAVGCGNLLRHLNDGGGAVGSLNLIEKLQEALPALVRSEEQRYLEQIRADVAAAVGAATTHDWTVRDSDVKCDRCRIDVVSYLLRAGAVPPCDEPGDCASFAPGHSIYGLRDCDTEGAGRCIYCKTVFPATVGGAHAGQESAR